MAYDLVVIGGGPAGEKAAAAAAYFGKQVALIERAASGPGGAMVHTGTLPSKTLRETALYLTGFRCRELYGGLSVEFPEERRSASSLMCRLSEVRSVQARQVMSNLARHGVDLIQGVGRLRDANHVDVGDRTLETNYVLVATGSSPRRPAWVDFSDPRVCDSDTLLTLDRLPESLAVVGGGVIGSEYACVLAAFGVGVEIIEGSPRLLPFLDADVSCRLMESMQDAGIRLHLGDSVEGIEPGSNELSLVLESGRRIDADTVLISAGRVGNTRTLGLEALGVVLDERGRVVVDDDFRTSVPSIFAAGDTIGRPALASTAMEQGRMAVSAMFDLGFAKRDWQIVPMGIYTIPEACACGRTESEVQAAGVPYVVGRAEMRHNALGQIIGETEGFVKLIVHKQTRELLGIHLVCERATELIHIGQAAMRLGNGIDYFIESVMTYPSLSVAYKYAAYDALGKLGPTTSTIPPLD